MLQDTGFPPKVLKYPRKHSEISRLQITAA
jgi:hypothetical protein